MHNAQGRVPGPSIRVARHSLTASAGAHVNAVHGGNALRHAGAPARRVPDTLSGGEVGSPARVILTPV